MIIEPTYIKFHKRILGDIKESFLLFFIIVTFSGLIGNYSIINLYLFFLFPVYILFFLQSYFSNRYCIKKTEIDETKNIIMIELYKFNVFFNKKNIPIRNVNVTVYKTLYSVLPCYKLTIYQDGKKIISQKENKMWTKSDFNNIKSIVNMLKTKK
jgi:hypothetical protein